MNNPNNESVTNERVSDLIVRIHSFGHGAGYSADEVLSVLCELLARREAAEKPVAYADPQSFDNFESMGGKNAACTKEWMWRDGAIGLVPLFTAPPLPVVPEFEPEMIEGMEVSVDVSTCDADAGHRYFGTVTEVSELDGAKHGYILLVQDAKPNFTPALASGNSPVTPDGWALVPIEPTENMKFAPDIRVGLSAWDGGQALVDMNECEEIYKAMIAAAPKPEVK